MGKVKETLLNEIYEKYELYDYDVIVKINEKIWKKKYDDVMEELTTRPNWGSGGNLEMKQNYGRRIRE